ncbi:MAG TPA: methionine adenosyltransferase [Candidatus Fournierella merdipullorum]|uniref:Methionine adenosyltransferase n=1 Tax=Candidatus Allofournierella merdipullorum TaxID=2838595 RepID=A0A9D2E320_9FIRM|nr:methionine adenosyltransferase [Candidatus Fournierella merdipullorum]
MKDKTVLTAESVTAGHPDKLCDTIADTVLDCCLEHDPQARVACEVMATAGRFIVAGEITAQAVPDIPAVVRDTVRRAGYGCGDLDIEVLIHPQSPDIAGAVEGAGQMGAGDQGVMYGYACSETDALLPLPVVLAHRLTALLACARTMGWIDGLLPDGKAQVSVEYEFGVPKRIAAIVLSCQHTEDKDLPALREELREFVITPALRTFPADADTGIYINPSGRFVLGGFEADTGLTGRKLMVDTYGGLAPHGGGALSGKDGTKVDRSGTYMARYIAKNIVAAGLAEKCTVTLAYAIGKAEPVAVDVDTHLTGTYPDEVLEQAVRRLFDLTPAGMIRTLRLDQPIFAGACNYGHFTRESLPWEQTDRVAPLTKLCAALDRGDTGD